MHTMTHYMELLATNQPWNLLIFMVIPVVLAEYIAVTELYILTQRDHTGVLKQTNRYAGIFAGLYFLGIFGYLFTTAVIPLTTQGAWRGVADVIAVSFYLLGVVPLLGMTLLGLGLIQRDKTAQQQQKFHATLVAIFLVVAHIAMIFGMLNPELL
jgi:hypothetical protein